MEGDHASLLRSEQRLGCLLTETAKPHTFLKAIRQLLPGVKYVDVGNLNFNPDVIRYADVVWIQRNCISHPQYWSVVKNCKLAGVQMRYFSYASAEKCAEQLVEWDRK